MSQFIKVLVAISMIGSLSACEAKSRNRNAQGTPDSKVAADKAAAEKAAAEKAAADKKIAEAAKASGGAIPDPEAGTAAGGSTTAGAAETKGEDLALAKSIRFYAVYIAGDELKILVRKVNAAKVVSNIELTGKLLKNAAGNLKNETFELEANQEFKSLVKASATCSDDKCTALKTKIKSKVETESETEGTIEVTSTLGTALAPKIVDTNTEKLNLDASWSLVKTMGIEQHVIPGSSGKFMLLKFFGEETLALGFGSVSLSKRTLTIYDAQGETKSVLGKEAKVKSLGSNLVELEYSYEGKSVLVQVTPVEKDLIKLELEPLDLTVTAQ